MPQTEVTMRARQVNAQVSAIDIQGEVTAAAEDMLMEAYGQAGGARTIILNFSQLDYMNSSGIGLLVTLLIRANRQDERLVAVNMSDHYRHIFDLTGLNQAITIYDTEADAVAAIVASS
ncbi:MAG: STAS domain-containing protein [Chloroflexi bacterium]|nr:STAS domain-containing protein [Chloroflexota bacterium]